MTEDEILLYNDTNFYETITTDSGKNEADELNFEKIGAQTLTGHTRLTQDAYQNDGNVTGDFLDNNAAGQEISVN